jgi:uncharacterized DUF497 family protein
VFTWAEAKREVNLRQHGIDFAHCAVVFDGPTVTSEDTREDYGEQRLRTLGLFYGVVVLMVWVDRPEAPHLISVRKAVRHEEKHYWQTVGK